jgi:aspartate/methionine/tyrosine aminotransferase
MRLTARTLSQIPSPIAVAETLLASTSRRTNVLDLSQGAPNYPTAPAIADRVAEVAHDPDGGRYTDRAGMPLLREVFSGDMRRSYGGMVSPDQVLITAGCNQAFCLVASALTDVGDEILLPVPYYFNHDMWLRLDRVTPVYFSTDANFVPSLEAAAHAITASTRAIVLVTPGNPTGVTIDPKTIERFAEFATSNNIVLILDETYRSFRDQDGPPHHLFARPDWPAHVVSLHSFSKDFAIPGYRVGAIVGDERLLAEVMKLFSCLAICAPRVGQEAAIAGLLHAQGWRDSRASAMRLTRMALQQLMVEQPGGFQLACAGAFYGWLRHPFHDRPTDSVVRQLYADHGVLLLPGTAFMPTDEGFVRVSLTGLDEDSALDFVARLREVGP